MKVLTVLCLSLIASAQAATIAIIDSGVDISHTALKQNIWKNSFLSTSAPYIQARHGWNFVENNNQVFDPLLLETFSTEVRLYNEVSARASMLMVQEEEKNWLKEKQKDTDFMIEVERLGVYGHGTHVAGIAVNNSQNKIMAIKFLSTPVKKAAAALEKKEERANGQKNFTDSEVEQSQENDYKGFLDGLAVRRSMEFREMGLFIKNHGATVANASFGMTLFQALNVVNSTFPYIFKRAPTKEELIKYAVRFISISLLGGKEFVAAAPDTLFVFAAGNDGISNDVYPIVPANVKADNTITVAATFMGQMLAPFSNHGVKNVEIAAPGVMIYSSTPGDEYEYSSGTSQAAPLVANIAGKVKDINPKLSPKEIKRILMETVDKKDFLKDKVTSGGIVNEQRALWASALSKSAPLDEAIEKARLSVGVTKSLKKKWVIPKNIRPIQLPPLFE